MFVFIRFLLMLVAGLMLIPSISHGQDAYADNGGQLKVTVPSKQPDGATIELTSYWFAARGASEAAASRRPAVVLLHGCGGPYNARGELSQRMSDYAAMINDWGYHVLIVDSLTARGEKELCTQKLRTRRVTQAHRRLDALAALRWLTLRQEVDASRIALMGWSNGGSTVLAATNQTNETVSVATVKPRAAVAFYPGCGDELKRGYSPTAPLLMMVGELDDWTPPGPCRDLAAKAQASESVSLEVLQGAYHGFDGVQPVKLREDVPNGVRPGKGVHAGGDAQARELSRVFLKAFLERELAGG